jgi:hypothetical protein
MKEEGRRNPEKLGKNEQPNAGAIGSIPTATFRFHNNSSRPRFPYPI